MRASDFVVIGGGIAGASVAYELAEHGDVVLLEREATCGHHATGRSAAVFTECYGAPIVRRLAMASRSFLETPPDGFADHPLASPRPILFIGREDQRVALDAAAREGAALVPSVRALDEAEATALCPVLRNEYLAGAVLEPNAMDLDVHGLHQAFLRGIRRRGGELRTRAGVTHLGRNGGSWTIRVGNDHLSAPVVVNAAGAWCDELARLAGVSPIGLVPMRRTAFTFAAPPGVGHRDWPMVVDVDERFYFKPEGPHLLASPADETPMDPCDAQPDEADVALAIDRLQAATTLDIRHVHSAWAGLRSFVSDRSPVVGMDPEHPGFFWLAGQGGYGIKTSPAMARAAAALIIDQRLPEDLTNTGIRAADTTSGPSVGPARLVTSGA